MITTATVISLAMVSLWLVVLIMSPEMRRLTFERKALMAVTWAIAIAVLAFVFSRVGF